MIYDKISEGGPFRKVVPVNTIPPRQADPSTAQAGARRS